MGTLKRVLALIVLTGILASCSGASTAVTPPATAAVVAATAAAPTDASAATEAPTNASGTLATPTSQADLPTQNPEQTATAAAQQSDADIKAGLQDALDRWSKAFNDGDANELHKAIDPKALALYRTQSSRLKYLTTFYQGRISFDSTVVDFNQRDHGYVQANVDSNGGRRIMTFKSIKGQWYLSEPRRAELGKKQKAETDHFTIEYYPWDQQVLPQLTTMLEDAYKADVEKLGRGPDHKPTIKLIPTSEVQVGDSASFLAYYQRTRAGGSTSSTIVVNSPYSFFAGTWDPSQGWEPELEITVAHELVHLITDCCFTSMARIPLWMAEGVAVYVSEGGYTNRYVPSLQRGIQENKLIPLKNAPPSADPSQSPMDLDHMDDSATDRDVGMEYGESASLVDYIVTQYGGLDTFWKLADAYDKTQSFDQALHNVLNTNIDDFEKGWRAELQKRFGG